MHLVSTCVHFDDEMSDCRASDLIFFSPLPEPTPIIPDAAIYLFECCSDFVFAQAIILISSVFAVRFNLAFSLNLILKVGAARGEDRVDGLYAGVSCRDERCFG